MKTFTLGINPKNTDHIANEAEKRKIDEKIYEAQRSGRYEDVKYWQGERDKLQ